MEISPAEEHEREWAARLMAASDPWVTLGVTIEECRRNCRDPRFQLYVARLEGEPCGMILLDRRGVAGSPYVKSVAVDPGRRGAGIGAVLLRFAEDLFRPEAKHIFLCVSSFNDLAGAHSVAGAVPGVAGRAASGRGPGRARGRDVARHPARSARRGFNCTFLAVVKFGPETAIHSSRKIAFQNLE
jgi:GNAT superfamily N-acetyltransferase